MRKKEIQTKIIGFGVGGGNQKENYEHRQTSIPLYLLTN